MPNLSNTFKRNYRNVKKLFIYILKKKNKIHIHGNNELSYIFWISKFKADYTVHFDIFWNALVDFISKFPFY